MAVVRELLAWQVTDLLEETARRIAAANIRSVADVRSARGLLVGFTPKVAAMKAALEQFLHERVYKHHRVLRMTANGKTVLQALFAEYVRSPQLLPEKHLRRWTGASSRDRPAAAGLGHGGSSARSIAWNEWSETIWPE